MKKVILSALIILGVSLSSSVFGQAKYMEGTSYTKLEEPISLFNDEQKEVVEFFSYTCPHCYSIEHYANEFNDSKPDNIGFYQVPVAGGRWLFSAKAKIVAEKLGIEKEFTSKFFSEYHKEKNRGIAYDYDEFEKFVVDNFEVTKEELKKSWDSFQVKNNLNQAIKKAKSANITSVPKFVVNGKYIVTAGSAGGKDKVFDVIQYLLDTTDIDKK